MKIQIENLQLNIEARVLVNSLSLTINAGECWVIIGRNGAGKSTLMRTLAGLCKIQNGEIYINERELAFWSLQKLAQLRAYLPQNQPATFSCSVFDAVMTARHPYRASQYWEDDEERKVVWQYLELMTVSHLHNRDLCTLSGGERQRVAIASALTQETPILLLDEPLTALDLAHQIELARVLKHLCRDQGKTIILIGHDLNLAYYVSSHVLLLMRHGGWQAGTTYELMQPLPLSKCLGHPIDALTHGGQAVFMARYAREK